MLRYCDGAMIRIAFALLLLLFGVARQNLGNTLSNSKLSLHLIGRYTPGAQKVIASGPRVLKILDLHSEMIKAARDYKSHWPEGQVVLRIYTQVRYPLGSDPSKAGKDFWEHVLSPPIMSLSQNDRRLIDFIEGPNECEHYPVWSSVEGARWFAKFWQSLAPLIKKNGFKPCVGSIPVGNPPGTPKEIANMISAFVPALVTAKKLDGAWSYHAYSLEYSTDLNKELWTSLRYRRFYNQFQRDYPELVDLPLILTEGGIDFRGDRYKDGWQARGSASKFQNWLRWFDGELRKDSYVLGCTLFQCGDARGWPSFEMEPVNLWLSNYLSSAR